MDGANKAVTLWKKKEKEKPQSCPTWATPCFLSVFSTLLAKEVSANTGHFIKISKTRPPDMFAELGKTQSDVPQQSDGLPRCHLRLCLSWLSHKITNWGCLHIYTGITWIKPIYLWFLTVLTTFLLKTCLRAKWCHVGILLLSLIQPGATEAQEGERRQRRPEGQPRTANLPRPV